MLRPFHSSTRNVQTGSLGAIVRSFKAASARRINLSSGMLGATIWPRNYYEPGKKVSTTKYTKGTKPRKNFRVVRAFRG
jgi:hypothetical protein